MSQGHGDHWEEEDLLGVLSALSSPHRLRLVARLRSGPAYVSQLARELGLSRPLIHMHLDKLERAGLVAGHLELSDQGKALRVFESTSFCLTLTPEVIAAALATPAAPPSTPGSDPAAAPGDPR